MFDIPSTQPIEQHGYALRRRREVAVQGQIIFPEVIKVSRVSTCDTGLLEILRQLHSILDNFDNIVTISLVVRDCTKDLDIEGIG
jgi:hypothetical protein